MLVCLLLLLLGQFMLIKSLVYHCQFLFPLFVAFENTSFLLVRTRLLSPTNDSFRDSIVAQLLEWFATSSVTKSLTLKDVVLLSIPDASLEGKTITGHFYSITACLRLPYHPSFP